MTSSVKSPISGLLLLPLAVGVLALTFSKILGILQHWKPAVPCDTPDNPSAAATFLAVGVPQLDSFMCIITNFFRDARSSADAAHPLLWEIESVPLMNTFVAAFAVLAAESTRFGPRVIPFVHWGALYVALVGTASQLIGFSIALPTLWLVPWILVDVVYSFLYGSKRSSALKLISPPLGRASQVRAISFATTIFVVIAFGVTLGPSWATNWLVYVFQWTPTLLPFFYCWPFSLLFESKRIIPVPASDLTTLRKESSNAAVNVFQYLIGMFTLHHIFLGISLIPYFFADPTNPAESSKMLAKGTQLLDILYMFLKEPATSLKPAEMQPGAFLFYETLSVPLTFGVWVMMVRGKTVLGSLGALIWYIFVAALLSPASAFLLAAIAREKEMEDLRVLAVSASNEATKKKKK
ncbi:hypothetical protein HDU96_005904 [Phlyctochytrium bullatum]|nr:hypothetical protein HDU96_005904 [Phlyctochytrium bullatum]